MAKNTKTYTKRKTFVKYDDTRYACYLNEVIIPDFVPYTPKPNDEEGSEEPTVVTGYEYTGTELDGGTLIESKDASRDNLINGIIRTKYSQSEEDAIKTHQLQVLSGDIEDEQKKSAYQSEWIAFNDFRQSAINQVDQWLTV